LWKLWRFLGEKVGFCGALWIFLRVFRGFWGTLENFGALWDTLGWVCGIFL